MQKYENFSTFRGDEAKNIDDVETKITNKDLLRIECNIADVAKVQEVTGTQRSKHETKLPEKLPPSPIASKHKNITKLALLPRCFHNYPTRTMKSIG